MLCHMRANLTHSADDGTATHSGIHGSTVVYNRLIGDLQQTSGLPACRQRLDAVIAAYC